MCRRLNGPFEPARPDPQTLDVLAGDVVAQSSRVLEAPIAKVGVAADPSLEVHQALAVPRQVNRTRHYVDVHEVVDDARLYVALVLVNKYFLAGVVDLHEGQVALVLLVEGLVLLPIMLDAQHEVCKHLLFVHVRVVGAADFYLLVKMIVVINLM